MERARILYIMTVIVEKSFVLPIITGKIDTLKRKREEVLEC